jgi:large subunit ribosomal protein L22
MYKAIESAIANATVTLKTSADLLKFKVLTVEEGQTLKRYLPGSRGNAKPIKKHMSHIKIILVAKGVTAVKKEEKKTDDKKVEAPKKTVDTKKTELKIKKQAETDKAKK